MSEERSCFTCAHEALNGDDHPCRTCFIDYSKWQPKEEVVYQSPPLAEIEPAPKAGLPTDAKARKGIPLYSGLIRYFPDALAAVAELSRIGNDQHNPGQSLHWDRAKSQDEHDALCRHLWEAGTMDRDGTRHSAKVAWRALAALQKEIEGGTK